MRQRRRRWLAWFPGWSALWSALRRAEWLEWFLLACATVVVLVLLFGFVWAARDGWDGLRATRGPHGTMTVTECHRVTGGKDPVKLFTGRWNCEGPFAGTGGVRIARVEAHLYADDRPGPTVRGRVSGPDADTVWVDGKFELVIVLLVAAGLPVALYWVVRLAVGVLEPAGGWPRPTKPKSPRGPTRPPQMGNRARRRRRRYRRTPDTPPV